MAAARRPRGTGGGGIAALPDELLVEVFSRVGSVKDLFRFAVTSRRWLRLFADPAFLRVLCPGEGKGHRARLLGFVFQRTTLLQLGRSKVEIRMMAQQHTSSVSAPTFLPTPGSPFGAMERALTSFVAADDGAFNYAEPLAARRGIVLMQLTPRSLASYWAADADMHRLFGLCNPATGERHVLPPLDRDVCVNGYAIVTAADDLDGKPPPSSSGRLTFSHLILLARRYQSHLHWYSAATRSWRVTHDTCLDVGYISVVGERSATVHRGAAHWLCKGRDASTSAAARDDEDGHHLYKLSAELGTRRVSLAKLPVRAGGTPLLWVDRDGKLSVACVYPSHASVWTQQREEEEEGAWLRTRVLRLPMAAPSPNDPQLLKVRSYTEKWFWFDRGTMLALYRGGGVCVLDLEEEAMEKVMDCFPSLCTGNPHMRYVPYEMDLVEFFVSRLGGISIVYVEDN